MADCKEALAVEYGGGNGKAMNWRQRRRDRRQRYRKNRRSLEGRRIM
jgi:hypothetical protein